jgi:hypothetical protein
VAWCKVFYFNLAANIAQIWTHIQSHNSLAYSAAMSMSKESFITLTDGKANCLSSCNEGNSV